MGYCDVSLFIRENVVNLVHAAGPVTLQGRPTLPHALLVTSDPMSEM